MSGWDAVVIGSGAAGSVMAYELACRGLRVAVVERGLRYDPQTFEHSEAAMIPRLYKHGGLQATEDHDLLIAQGSTVGGSTVINNAIWLRCDLDRVLPEWASHGAHFDRARLEAAYDSLEGDLRVDSLAPALGNRGAELFLGGARSEGLQARYLNNNRESCIACGWCNYGCRYNRKTSMLVTYVPWAESRGVEFLDGCQDVRIALQGNRAVGVEFLRNGAMLRLRADRVVVCAGAIGSSEVLLASGVHANGRVGVGLHALAGVFVTAETEQEVEGFDGIGLCCVVDAGDDVVIESYFAPPLVFSLSVGGWFGTHFERMRNYRRFAQAGVMVGMDPTGRVRLDRKGRTRIDLRASEQDLARLRRGIASLARMYFAAGATRVLPATFKIIEFSNPSDLQYLDDLVHAPDDILLGSAHPQGGNTMSEDPARGAVDGGFKVHGTENLFVADASVFPTNIWANCQATVMAVAHYAADAVAR